MMQFLQPNQDRVFGTMASPALLQIVLQNVREYVPAVGHNNAAIVQYLFEPSCILESG